jgi:hypothetical protein
VRGFAWLANHPERFTADMVSPGYRSEPLARSFIHGVPLRILLVRGYEGVQMRGRDGEVIQAGHEHEAHEPREYGPLSCMIDRGEGTADNKWKNRALRG